MARLPEWFQSHRRSTSFGRRHRPCLEPLEDRCVPTVYTVNSTAINLTVDGKVTLLEAVTAANNDSPSGDAPAGFLGDFIQFDSSLNGQVISIANSSLVIIDDLTITGPGADLLTIAAFNTHIFNVNDFNFIPGTISVAISGLTLTDGDSNTAGAIYNAELLTLSDMVIFDNIVENNNSGGGIYNIGSLTIQDSFLGRNGTTSGGHGGAIFNGVGGSLMASNCTFSGNGAGSGGAIYNEGTALVNNSRFLGNVSDTGGGIFNANGATVTVNNSSFSGNNSFSLDINSGDGGGMVNHGTATLSGCTLSGNSASGVGGGIYTTNLLTLNGSTISGNSARAGGGIFNRDDITANGCTIYANAAQDTGGGIFNREGDVLLVSTIVAGNRAVNGGADLARDSVDIAYSLIQTGFNWDEVAPGTNLFGVDPLLAPLANNGGPTLTHALLPGSPALDRGSNPLNLTEDQRGFGFERVIGFAADMGATEARFADVRLVPDPSNRSKNVLVVVGTRRADDINVYTDDDALEVFFNNDFYDFDRTAVSRLAAFGMEGGDNIRVEASLALPALLDGGRGGDTLSGGAADDILLGRWGGDVLLGNNGRDILLGGAGSDRLTGGKSDDLLVGGATLYDGNHSALSQIRAVWISADTYSNRANRIRTGVSVPMLSAAEIIDTSFDTLTGDNGLELFFISLGDAVLSRATGEQVV